MATKLIVVIFFVTYLSQIIMMDTLNLHSSVCQLPLNKARRTKKKNSVVNYRYPHQYINTGAFQAVQLIKNLPAMLETWVRSLGQDSLKKCMATLSSILAWIIPWTEEPGGLQFIGSHAVSRQN